MSFVSRVVASLALAIAPTRAFAQGNPTPSPAPVDPWAAPEPTTPPASRDDEPTAPTAPARTAAPSDPAAPSGPTPSGPAAPSDPTAPSGPAAPSDPTAPSGPAAPPDPDTLADGTLDPDTLAGGEPTNTVTPAFPLALAMRPQILPAGTLSATLVGGLGHAARPDLSFVYGTLSVGVGYSTGETEVAFGAQFLAFDTQEADYFGTKPIRLATVTSLWASLRHLVGDDLVAYGELLGGSIDDEQLRRFAPNAGLSKKLHLSDRAAVLLGAGLTYTRGNIGVDNGIDSYSELAVDGFAAVEAQLAERVCAYASTSASQHVYLDDPGDGFSYDTYDSYRSYVSRVALQLTASRAIDIWLNLIVYSTGDYDTKAFSLTLDLRRLP